MDEIIVMWRCTKCEKFSHARRRPPRHLRWVSPGHPEYDRDRDSAPGDLFAPEGHSVTCGPFERWEARRADG